jgi:hypothetical protein
MFTKNSSIKLPDLNNPDGCPVTYSFSILRHNLLVSLALVGNQFYFGPFSYSQVGNHLITVYLTDRHLFSRKYTFNLNVINLPPILSENITL